MSFFFVEVIIRVSALLRLNVLPDFMHTEHYIKWAGAEGPVGVQREILLPFRGKSGCAFCLFWLKGLRGILISLADIAYSAPITNL